MKKKPIVKNYMATDLITLKKNMNVSLVMGSQSDWDTMKLTSNILKTFNILI